MRTNSRVQTGSSCRVRSIDRTRQLNASSVEQRLRPGLRLLRGPLFVLLEEQAVGLTPLVGHVLSEGRRVIRRCDLPSDHLDLRRVEPVEPDIERYEVLE